MACDQTQKLFWQIKQPRTRCFDDLLHSITFVGRQVVDDDDVAALEGWSQTFFKISEKGGSGHLAIYHKGRNHLVMASASIRMPIGGWNIRSGEQQTGCKSNRSFQHPESGCRKESSVREGRRRNEARSHATG